MWLHDEVLASGLQTSGATRHLLKMSFKGKEQAQFYKPCVEIIVIHDKLLSYLDCDKAPRPNASLGSKRPFQLRAPRSHSITEEVRAGT